jgi:hypothetical protein
VLGVEGRRRRSGAAPRGFDAQDACEIEEAERAAVRVPGRDEPARRIEREREDAHRALGRAPLGIREADAGSA